METGKQSEQSRDAGEGGIETYLKRFGTFTYRFSGVSMLPLLRQNRDDFTVRAVEHGEIPAKGDVILFKDELGRYILHRVIRVDGATVTTRGDNCRTVDRPIDSSRILGIMTGYMRNGREHAVTDTGYRLYSAIIRCSTPIRLAYKNARRLAGMALRRMKHGVKGA